MQRRRLRTVAMAFAIVAVVTLGRVRSASADILVTVIDNPGSHQTVQTFDNASNTQFQFSFSAGSYTGSLDAVVTNFPGNNPASIGTTVNITGISGNGTLNPETLVVQVQLVNFNSHTPSSSTNLLWNTPSGTPVNVGASGSFSASGDSGTVTTNTYFNSTTSTTTTGIGTSTISATQLNGETGRSTSVTNPNQTYTLSQVVTLSNLNVPNHTGTKQPDFGGTSTVNGPNAVPEPSTMAIAGLGALGMIGYGLRRRKALGA
jgi:hypothetical protein